MSFPIPFSTSNFWARLLLVMLSVIYLMIFVSGGLSPSIAVKAAPPAVWSLVWSDEFSGPGGAAIDSTKWTRQVGGGGWGNDELEYYTSRLENSYQSGGFLVSTR